MYLSRAVQSYVARRAKPQRPNTCPDSDAFPQLLFLSKTGPVVFMRVFNGCRTGFQEWKTRGETCRFPHVCLALEPNIARNETKIRLPDKPAPPSQNYSLVEAFQDWLGWLV